MEVLIQAVQFTVNCEFTDVSACALPSSSRQASIFALVLGLGGAWVAMASCRKTGR
jgi:hypothetical protein